MLALAKQMDFNGQLMATLAISRVGERERPLPLLRTPRC